MKFEIIHNDSIESRALFYIADEYAFDSEPYTPEIDFEIIINQMALSVVDGKVIQVSGFCPYGNWICASYKVPNYSKGSLQILNDIEPGFSYALTKNNWPIYVNTQTGWVCVGNPQKHGNAVEFMNGCVAVIENNILISLWLKPKSLPSLRCD